MLEFMRPFFNSREDVTKQKRNEITKAYTWIRENNDTIPDEILNLMYNSALEKISEDKLTRFEYIDKNGRVLVERGEFEIQLQDNGRTLKIFKN